MRSHLFAGAALLAALATSLPATAQHNHDSHGEFAVGDLKIAQIWARETAPTAKSGGSFMIIMNHGSTDDRLIGATGDIAERIELHTHLMDDGVMRMRPVEAIELPAGGEAKLQPGGDHVMFIGLTEPLVEGSEIPVTLIFEEAGEIEVMVKVEDIAHGGDGHHDGHGEGHDHGHGDNHDSSHGN